MTVSVMPIVKKSLLFTLLLLLSSQIFAHSGASLSLSGSFSLRASGSEANYWNPANLAYPQQYQAELLLINSYFSFHNNAFSIGRYNDMNGSYLTDPDKQKIIDDLDKSFTVESEAYHNLAGFSIKNLAFSSRINMFAKGNLSSRYLELLLVGNEYGRDYKFAKKHNNIELLGYVDWTFGISPYNFQIGDQVIHSGISLSLLTGLAVLTTEAYTGVLSVSDAGVDLQQDISIKRGQGGYGFKSMIGFRSEISENLCLGLSMNNIGGFIHWTKDTERRHYTARIDSVYIINLDKDIFEHSETLEKAENFTTALPISVNMAALYRWQNISISFDWKQGFVNSVLTDKTPELSMGSEYYSSEQVTLRMGFSPGLGRSPYHLSYGGGFTTDRFTIDIGIKSEGSPIPSIYSKGIALAITSKWKFR